MTATQHFRKQSATRMLAVLLALPLAILTTGCASTGRMALSLGLHAHTQSSSSSELPRTTHFTAVPHFESHLHHRAARPLLVETAHHKQHNDLRASRLTDMKEGVATDAFTPINGETTSN